MIPLNKVATIPDPALVAACLAFLTVTFAQEPSTHHLAIALPYVDLSINAFSYCTS